MKLLARGKRGLIYLDGKTLIKKTNPKTFAINTINTEIFWLKRLNKFNIGPNLLESGDNWFRMEYIKGILLKDFLKNYDKKELKKVILEILKPCRILDKLKVNKFEMHSPLKHAIIKWKLFGYKVTLLDFERCRATENPKNVSQFYHFIQIHLNCGGKVLNALKEYQKKQNDENFKEFYSII